MHFRGASPRTSVFCVIHTSPAPAPLARETRERARSTDQHARPRCAESSEWWLCHCLCHMPSCDRLLTCSHCGSVLLSADHRGGTVACMDRALVHHTSASCQPGNRVEATLRALGPLLQAITHGEATVAEVTRLVHWPDDEPPLVFCARHRPLRSVALAMLESGLAAETASLDATSKDGLTALHLAALQDDAALLAALCEAGADASMQSQDNAAAQLPGGRTALHCVRSVEAARHLIASCPAALLTPDWQGSLPAQVAQLHGTKRRRGL